MKKSIAIILAFLGSTLGAVLILWVFFIDMSTIARMVMLYVSIGILCLIIWITLFLAILTILEK